MKIGAALGQSTIGERIVYEISAKKGSHNTNDSIKEFSQNRGIFLKILENTRLPWRGTFCLWDALMQLAILKRLQSSTGIRLWAGGEGTE